MSMHTDIARYKAQLITKAKNGGIYEDFGQKEVRKLRNKYGVDYTFNRNTQPIDDFDNWCSTYSIS